MNLNCGLSTAALLKPVFDLIVKHAQCHHLISERVGAWNDNRFDAGKYIELFKSTSNGIGHDLSRQMGYVDAMPGIALGIKDIR